MVVGETVSLNCKVIRCVGCGEYVIAVEHEGELRGGWINLKQFICAKCNYISSLHLIEDQVPSSLVKCGRCHSIIGVITFDTMTPFGQAGISKTYLTSNCEKCLLDGEALEATIKRVSYTRVVNL